MGRAVIPVRSLSMRLPDAGRIRIGTSEEVKGRKAGGLALRLRAAHQEQTR